jgi:alkylation response protein AidB-like acyl-CoA dehydrogenase
MTAIATAERPGASSPRSFDALLATVKEISPLLSEQATAGEKQGKLTEATIGALSEAGAFGAFVPKALGGAELWPVQGIEIIEALSRADGSTGWVFMATQVAMATCGAYLAPAAAKTVFANCIPLIAGQGAPVGKADAVDGGYRLSGNWSYGSGLLPSEWIHTGALVHRNGALAVNPKNQHPEARIFIVPVAEAKLTNNWDVLGLRSTGSIDYSMRNVLVSEEFTHALAMNRPLTGGDLYRVGILGFAAIGHSGFALGIARRTLDEIAALATSAAARPTPLTGAGGGDNFQLQYGRAEGQLYAARAFVFDVWNDVQRRLESGNDPTVRQISLARLAFTNANSVATSIANFAFESGGGAALRAGNIQRCFRDQRTAAQHITASEAVVRECAKDLLGLAKGKIWTLRQLVDP